MAVLGNLAKMSTATTGTGTITLLNAVTGFLSFADAGISNGDTVSYAIEDGNNREVGRGVYTSSGTTLTRSVLASTNSGAAISLSGNAQVFITALAEDLRPASQSQAEAGADNSSLMSPLRTAQAIAALGFNIEVETFTSSGTFSKDADDILYFVEVWGAGGSGSIAALNTGGGGGGGGEYVGAFIDVSGVGSSVTVTVASGAAAVTANGNGNDGGNSSFGSILTARGGKAGITTAGGKGGDGVAGSTSGYGGGGGGHNTGNPGNSTMGGAGGGSSGSNTATNVGGKSAFGGNGGNGGSTGSSGSARGGGGGAGNSGTSGAGGRGEVRITHFKRRQP